MTKEYLYVRGYIVWNYRDEEEDDTTGFIYDEDKLDEDEREWLRDHNDMDWRN